MARTWVRVIPTVTSDATPTGLAKVVTVRSTASADTPAHGSTGVVNPEQPDAPLLPDAALLDVAALLDAAEVLLLAALLEALAPVVEPLAAWDEALWVAAALEPADVLLVTDDDETA